MPLQPRALHGAAGDEAASTGVDVPHHFQARHQFDLYRLDVFDKRRWLLPTGWDAFSPPGTIARLDRVRGPLARDAVEQELLAVRGMRRIFRVKRNLTAAEWRLVKKPVYNVNPQTKRPFTWARVDLLLVHRSLPLLAAGGALPLPSYSVEAAAAAAVDSKHK